MSKIKFLFLALVIGLTFSTYTFAEVKSTSQKAMIVAEVGIGSSKIVSQVGNNFNISFNITNKEGIQPNVKYGVRLIEKSNTGQKTIDEKVYDETLTLAENSNISKNVVYSATESLTGTYSLYIMVFNSNGLPLAISSLGDVKLVSSNKGVELVNSSCAVTTKGNTVSQSISKVVNLRSADIATLNCSISNQTRNQVSLLTVFETRTQSLYGDLVQNVEAPYNDRVTLKSLEKKNVSVNLPVASEPGVYSLSFKYNFGNEYSNTINLSYKIEGQTATIMNISPDADYYERGATANISVLWIGSGAETTEVKIQSGESNILCGETTTFSLARGQASIAVPIKRNCANPSISVVMKGTDGNILDEQAVSVKTTSREVKSSIFEGFKGAILIVIILLALAGLGIYMKRKNTGGIFSKNTLTILIIGLAVSLIPFSKASANSYIIGPQNDIFVNVTLSHLPGSPNQVPGVYTPGETIQVDGHVFSSSPISNIVTFSAINLGDNVSVNLFSQSQETILSQGTINAVTRYLTAPACGQPTCSYDVEFSSDVEELASGPATIGTVFMIGPHMHGATGYRKVVYVGERNHGPITVLVKNFGRLDPTYQDTTNPAPENEFDQVFTVPESTGYGTITQIGTCTSNCGIPLSGFNYATTYSASASWGGNIATYIPSPYHVCKYEDAPWQGLYFSPAYYSTSIVDDTCANRYPDSITIY